MKSGYAALALSIGAWLLAQGYSNATEVTQLVDMCEQRSGEPAIAACGAVIASGKFKGVDLAAAYYRRATLRSQAKQWDAAIEDYSAALRLHPNFVEAFNDRGIAYGAIGKNDLALSDFSSEIRFMPEQPNGYALRATVYTAMGQHEKALDDLNHAISMTITDPSQLASVLSLRGFTNETLHRHEAAEADVAKAISMAPGNPLLLHEACWVRAASGRQLEKALDFCNQALQLMPNDNGYRDTRALVYLRLGQLVDARNEYDAVLKVRPDYAHALFGRGVTKIRSGDKIDGRADIAAALKIDPKMAREFEAYGIKP